MTVHELTYEDLNNQQKAAVDDCVRWFHSGAAHERPYILQGYAGTGKTTLLKILIERLRIRYSEVALTAPTNRAAKVLANKTGLFTSTVHKLIYITVSEEINFQRERLRIWDESKSFAQLGEELVIQSGQDLEGEYRQLCYEQDEDFDGVIDKVAYEIFKEGRCDTILKFEGIELPDDALERQALFEEIKKEKLATHKQNIRDLMAEDIPVIKKDPLDLVMKYKLFLVDESSMVNQIQGRDITSYGIPTILVGDPFQLPPVKAKPFWEGMKADTVLTRIERQKGPGAGIPLAGERLRKGEQISRNESLTIHPKSSLDDESWTTTDQIICGTHKTRERLCRFVRKRLGHNSDHPQKGEKVVAVYNDKSRGIMNGELYSVEDSELLRNGTVCRMTIKDPYGRVIEKVDAWTRGFGGRSNTDFLDDQFGKFWWGYAITCHQSQGSEWKNIVVCDDWPGDSHDRWLYTAITRAAIKCELVQ